MFAVDLLARKPGLFHEDVEVAALTLVEREVLRDPSGHNGARKTLAVQHHRDAARRVIAELLRESAERCRATSARERLRIVEKSVEGPVGIDMLTCHRARTLSERTGRLPLLQRFELRLCRANRHG